MKAGFGDGVNRVRRVHPRIGLTLFILACVIWVFWHPLRMDALFMSIPAAATVASYHDGSASEWKGLVSNPRLVAVLEGLGVRNAAALKDNAGIYQTLYWLTGRHTVLGWVPNPGMDVNTGLPAGHLVGASHVGWKATFMALLWRVKWVPGLGRLQTTPSGTRYLTFKVDDAPGGVLFLGLDIADGILLATLSHNPEDVRVPTDRLHRFGPKDAPADAFGGRRSWRKPLDGRHRFWIADEPVRTAVRGVSGGVMLDVSTLRADHFDLRLRARITEPALKDLRPLAALPTSSPVGADLPGDAAFMRFVCDARLAKWAADAVSPRPGEGVLSVGLSGKPFEGRLMGLAYPALTLALPWHAEADFEAWARNWVGQSGADVSHAGLVKRFRSTAEASTLFVFSSQLEVLERAAIQDMAFVEKRGGVIYAGTHYGSYERQRRAWEGAADGRSSVRTVVGAWREQHPGAVAVLRVNLPDAAAEFAHLGAIARLALPFLRDANFAHAVMQLGGVVDVLQALSPLGEVEAVAGVTGEDEWQVRVRTAAAAR